MPNPNRLQVKRRLGVPGSRWYTRVAGVSPNIKIVPFNSTINTLERAVKERVFYVNTPLGFQEPPKPADGLFQKRLAGVFDILKRELPRTAPISHDDFVNSYKGRKHATYKNALEELRNGCSTLEKDAEISTFIKYEKTDWTTKSDPVPRVISPRSPMYHIRLGRYLKTLEKPLLHSLDSLYGHRTVVKGMDNDRVAALLHEKWEMFKKPVAVGLDASRFDQHISKQALEFEHRIYLECFPRKIWKKKLARLLELQLVNKCKGYVEDGSVKYTVQGTRMSGDMNTSLGNCLLMCTMLKAYSLHCGVNYQLANNGDDCVVFMEQSDLEKFSTNVHSWFTEMGFTMKVEDPVYEFEHIEFCQTKPVFDGAIWTMCRNPITAIAKDAVMLQHPNQGRVFYPLWLDAVGTGGIRLAGGLPVFQSYYSCLQRGGVKEIRTTNRRWTSEILNPEILPWYMREGGISGKRDIREISPEARASFYLAYGITPDEQICLEEFYDGLVLRREVASEWFPREIPL